LKNHFYISIFLFLVFASCANTKNTSSENLTPTLSVNGYEFNSAIINYNPNYGFDSPDGDVLMGEIEIRISELVENQQTLRISGDLTGIYINNSEEKLINATIKVLDRNRNLIEEFRADSIGSFELNFDYENGYLLEFNYIGYRTLFVDIPKMVAKV
tara:strand:- start:146 stop:616 length:471 start_codon:yes stop_codon:yes gene_type:complete